MLPDWLFLRTEDEGDSVIVHLASPHILTSNPRGANWVIRTSYRVAAVRYPDLIMMLFSRSSEAPSPDRYSGTSPYSKCSHNSLQSTPLSLNVPNSFHSTPHSLIDNGRSTLWELYCVCSRKALNSKFSPFNAHFSHCFLFLQLKTNSQFIVWRTGTNYHLFTYFLNCIFTNLMSLRFRFKCRFLQISRFKCHFVSGLMSLCWDCLAIRFNCHLAANV